MRRGAWLMCVAGLGCALAPFSREAAISDGRYVMGTLLEVTLSNVSEGRAHRTFDALFAHAARLETLMTRFDSESEISRLNLAAGLGPQPVDPELAEVLRRSVAYASLTDGTFDVTVGPLVRLWIDAAVAGAPPSDRAIEEARARVGSDAIRLHPDGTAELLRPGVEVDLGGIAKGYALDTMVPMLRERRVEGALLSFGQSSTVALGSPPNGDRWQLLARGPDEEVLGVLTLSDQALSVSSSFGHWLDVGDQRYGHVIDPRSGRPLTRPSQAMIVAPDATLAEALSKALLILEPAEGLALLARLPGCSGLLVDGDGTLLESSGWAEATRWEPGLPALLEPPDDPQEDGAAFRFEGHGRQGTLVLGVQRRPAPRG